MTLSGSDAYQGVILPLIKAMQHLKALEMPPPTFVYFDRILIIGLAVIDAPMVGVRVTGDGPQTYLMPWIRVVRHDAIQGEHKGDRSHTYGIDIVHKDFLVTYVNDHVLPFAQQFVQLALKHHNVLAEARGFVSGMGSHHYENIEPYLEEIHLPRLLLRAPMRFCPHGLMAFGGRKVDEPSGSMSLIPDPCRRYADDRHSPVRSRLVS